jgi:FkbM family methyltransferase
LIGPDKSETGGAISRTLRFLRKPFHEKSRSLYAQWRRIFPDVPFPVRLSFGAWWIARNDGLGASLTYGGLEAAERSFVARFLQPGMTVLDIGAHHGLYTLLASKRVGSTGRVFAFEPSPRERKALLLHLLINRCKNVLIQDLALGRNTSESNLHVAESKYSGFNSLKPPGVSAKTSPIRVRVVRLDDWLSQFGIDRLDFIKLDVEGGELSVLQGAMNLFQRKPRPVILAEVQDIRTRPWGYRAQEIISELQAKSYRWFALTEDGKVYPLHTARSEFEGNFVACPEESLAVLQATALTSP